MARELIAKQPDYVLRAERRQREYAGEVSSDTSEGFILMETGDYILQENGDKIIVESGFESESPILMARRRDYSLRAPRRTGDD